MATRIKFTQISDYTERNIEKLMDAVIAETYKSLVNKSPVKSGRFRVSWAVGQNSASYQGAPAGKESYPKPNPDKPNRIGYQKEKVGNTYYVYNNLPYAEKLETAAIGEGGSVQTDGPGWVRATAKRIQTLIPTLSVRVDAES